MLIPLADFVWNLDDYEPVDQFLHQTVDWKHLPTAEWLVPDHVVDQRSRSRQQNRIASPHHTLDYLTTHPLLGIQTQQLHQAESQYT